MGGSWEIEIPSGHGGCFNTSRHGLMSRHMTWMICRLISDFLGIMYINYTHIDSRDIIIGCNGIFMGIDLWQPAKNMPNRVFSIV